MYPGRTTKHEREFRTALEHILAVEYITSTSIWQLVVKTNKGCLLIGIIPKFWLLICLFVLF